MTVCLLIFLALNLLHNYECNIKIFLSELEDKIHKTIIPLVGAVMSVQVPNNRT